MDDDIFPGLSVINAKRTYIKKAKKLPQPRHLSDNKEECDKIEPLTTKVAIKFLLEGKLKSKVCRYCLNITPGLTELDQIMKIAGTGNIYKVTIRDIVASFHPFKVVEDPNFPNKICQKCLDRALGAYLFTQQCERAERAMLNCFDDMYEKFEKLDPIERPKKRRGRQKLKPNYNILYAEHRKVIDYAEPIINIVNVGAEMVTKEPELKELECKKCWQVLPNLESLLNHEKIHPKTMWYHCRLCGKSFPKCNQLKKHYNKVHVLSKEVETQLDKDFQCKECNSVTDNFIQHLQHVEKHKFKNMMEHLIERRMDKLCAVCFNNSAKMTDLDKMVCIHGGHPDLMGDKTIYAVLASTLPNQKLYKYQELYVPSRAKIMTISKASIKNKNPLLSEDKMGETFVFSHPTVITKNHVKTDHFYHYVFSDPEYNIDINCTMDLTANQTKKLSSSKTIEVLEVEKTQQEPSDNTTSIKTITIGRPKQSSTTEVVKIYDSESEPSAKKLKVDTKETEAKTFISNDSRITEEDLSNKLPNNENIPHAFNIPNNALANNEHKKKDNAIDFDKVISWRYVFSNPESTEMPGYKNLDTKITEKIPCTVSVVETKGVSVTEEKITMKCAAERQTIDSSDKYSIFKTTLDEYKAKAQDAIAISKSLDIVRRKTENCKFCWIFKHNGTCNYCKKPIQNMAISDEYGINDSLNRKDEKIWQCNICLTNNNADRQTCQCCGTSRTTVCKDMKINFGTNKTFQIKTTGENYTPQDIVKENNFNKVAIIEEASMMDYGTNAEENTEPTIVNINMQSMDIETNNNTCDVKDFEAMDVEENPINLNKSYESPLFNFNICTNTVDTAMPIKTFPITNSLNVGTNLQFNIGSSVDNKPPRKLKRVLRKSFQN